VLSTAVYLCAYAAAVLFLLGVAVKVVSYRRKPMHLRWELYPVAHEGKRSEYGGSYLEETDWVKRPRHKSLIGELRVMVPEILFLKAVHESNRSLWIFTLPFHLGLYLTAGFFFVLLLNASALAAGFASAIPANVWISVLNALGLCGFALSIIGALGLVCRRAVDENLRGYTSFAHLLNLGWFVVAPGLAVRAWFADGHSFAGFRDLAVSLVTLDTSRPVAPHILAPAILGAALVAYIPWTHMAHFFMKYFLYHDIRWGDEPMVGSERAEARLREALNYKPTWAAKHVHADGQKTWEDVALLNPAQEKSKE
jgi:nitrate reductase gamma subunit